jgi:DUF4097 and DUF4098 domain-containing protein YvlB
MSDERDRILKLLEDGKITADQAARLIEAMGARRQGFDPMPPIPSLRPLHRRMHYKEFDRIPDLVASAVSSAVRSGLGPEGEGRSVFADARGLDVKSVSGDVEVQGWDEARVSLSYSGGMVKTRVEGDIACVRSVSGDVEAEVPRAGSLELETVSGDVSVEGMTGRLVVKTVSGDIDADGLQEGVEANTVSGDIELTDVAGEVEVQSRSGDIDIAPSGQFSGAASSKSGDITLSVRPGADVLVEMTCEDDGDVDIQLDMAHEVIEQDEHSAKVRLGAGNRSMELRTRSADITLRDAEEE